MAFLSVGSRLNRAIGHRWCGLARCQHHIGGSERHSSTDAPDAVQKVEYPPILDVSKKAVRTREKISWHDQVKAVQTIEEKLIKVNMPYYWGLRTIPLQNDEYHYNCLPYFQHWTRTQYEDGIPETWSKQSPEEVDRLVALVRAEIVDAIVFQYGSYR